MTENMDIKVTNKEEINQQQIVDKIKQALDNLDYNFILTTLHNVNTLPQPASDKIKKQCITLFNQHLQTVYNIGSENKTISYDLDTMLQIYSLLMTTNIQPESTSQTLKFLIQHSITQDPRYAFLIYRSKYTTIGQENNEISLICRLKFIRYLGLFIQGIVGRGGAMVGDFVHFVTQIRKAYEMVINSLDMMNKDEDQHCELNSAYIQYCKYLLTAILQFQTTSTITPKQYQIISTSISLSILTYTSNNHNITTNLQQLNKIILKLIQSTPRTFSISSLSNYPILFLVTIIKNQCYISMISSVGLVYLFYRVLCGLGSENTFGNKVGSVNDKLDTILQYAIIQLCKIIISINQGVISELKIQGQLIWLTSEIYIDMLEIYRRFAIYSGFICAEYSKQCWGMIKEILKFDHNRYKECPILTLKIWENILTKSNQKQISFRIFCMSEYRKILISHKNKIRDNIFETHHYHSHGSIFIDSGKILQKQIQIILNFPEPNIDYNYIGHVISFISNWLTCCKAYASANSNYSSLLIKEINSEVKISCQKITEKAKKSMEIDKERLEKKIMQVELVLFRLKELEELF